jgi:protein involved in polysaccharide export with SLBB domain
MPSAGISGNRGGKRPGAGRPKGAKSRRTAETIQKALDAAGGVTPLEFMLKVMRNPKRNMKERIYAASVAAPYVHPKLSAVTVAGDPNNPLHTKNQNVNMTPTEFEEIVKKVAADV